MLANKAHALGWLLSVIAVHSALDGEWDRGRWEPLVEDGSVGVV